MRKNAVSLMLTIILVCVAVIILVSCDIDYSGKDQITQECTISFQSNGGSTITAMTNRVGDNIEEPSIPIKRGYIFDGWYIDNDTFEKEFKFIVMPDEDITLYAQWVDDEKEQISYQRINMSGVPTVNGSYLLFGEYPQTIKSNNVTISSVVDNNGYYLGSDDNYYAKVIATPNSSNYKFSNNITMISGVAYYFKVGPIRWRILSEDEGTALILCESIIANKRFHQNYSDANDGAYANNYEKSEIRNWLNEEFYNTAFNNLQKQIILTLDVDNDQISTGYPDNQYICDNTYDKIFLPSYTQMISYGFSCDSSNQDSTRARIITDYSRATGAWMDTKDKFYGNGYWWLRSPSCYDSLGVRSIDYNGRIYNDCYVGNSDAGIVPALVISLK